MKEAYDAEFAAVIERAEKQILLARHGRRLLALLDDDPVTPGDARRAYSHGAQARQVLHDAEEDLKNWVLQLDEVKEAGTAVKADLPNLNDDATTAAETDASTPAVTKTRTPARLQESTDTTAVPGSS